MEGGNKEEKGLSMDGVSESFKGIEFPVQEFVRIQEALKPLGYIVYGFGQEDRFDFTLNLHFDSGIRVIPWNDPPNPIGA